MQEIFFCIPRLLRHRRKHSEGTAARALTDDSPHANAMSFKFWPVSAGAHESEKKNTGKDVGVRAPLEGFILWQVFHNGLVCDSSYALCLTGAFFYIGVHNFKIPYNDLCREAPMSVLSLIPPCPLLKIQGYLYRCL